MAGEAMKRDWLALGLTFVLVTTVMLFVWLIAEGQL
jgi:hypothetical protein